MRWLALALVFGVACTTPPVDPEGTLERIRGGTMRVGITASEPWTESTEDGPAGIEVEIVERLAEELDAEIEWVPGSEEELFGALKYSQVDLVIGGLGAKNPFAKEASLTHPYLTTQVVVAVPESDDVPEDISGLVVAAEPGTEATGVLFKTDAAINLFEDVAEAAGTRAIDNWLLDDLGLVETGVTLTETDHVMAVRLGENGWLVRVEKFLLDHAEEIEQLLAEVEP
ncbi:MAG: transporter substrate-binding domain-containing protein [Actinobacteria bacterium]|jgi:polar amino acid transport system substrate-binding protein|nr:transporter substrate-binding domain-containing protein [Actinomycetota bacterium]